MTILPYIFLFVLHLTAGITSAQDVNNTSTEVPVTISTESSPVITVTTEIPVVEETTIQITTTTNSSEEITTIHFHHENDTESTDLNESTTLSINETDIEVTSEADSSNFSTDSTDHATVTTTASVMGGTVPTKPTGRNIALQTTASAVIVAVAISFLCVKPFM